MSSRGKSNQLRIIGGRWRGRKLNFPDVAGLRPSPDRVRETLFNWLAPVIAGAHCLDLFAGSGALGFEAASRGAAEVVLVESEAAAADALRNHVQRLDAGNIVVWQSGVMAYLQGPADAFDIVFLDPPFGSDLLLQSVQALQAGDWLRPGAYVYLETQRNTDLPLAAEWELLRSKTAGQVGYHLARVRGAGDRSQGTGSVS